ncbi:zinc ribbon domain-containing protein [Aliidiomarina maris]|uniref:GTP-binding protein n=1 Tax=Aliidiomarina maris TaxID=531312 RepID=A0A327WPX8_9GAMM|nr:zinc ribbon domain-containing protein [Aliidiomarina maris]MBA3988791.1 GTP-binding protein [Idiomarina sp.]MCL5051009.1 zinc ribbon domain-containing protein [Bacillota bacterium]RAJ93288.1 hypothetical protein B0I24_12015 [Aliidiomarina maris]RUO18544.1 GTP-binding protein [Aliidiomarina maris]
MEAKAKFECFKCKSNQFEAGQLRGKGGLVSAIFNLNNKRFRYVSCKRCGYTEFYSSVLGGGQKAVDFFTG